MKFKRLYPPPLGNDPSNVQCLLKKQPVRLLWHATPASDWCRHTIQ